MTTTPNKLTTRITPVDAEHAALEIPIGGLQWGTTQDGLIIQCVAPVPMQLFKQLSSKLAIPPEALARHIQEAFVNDPTAPPSVTLKIRRSALTDETEAMLKAYESRLVALDREVTDTRDMPGHTDTE